MSRGFTIGNIIGLLMLVLFFLSALYIPLLLEFSLRRVIVGTCIVLGVLWWLITGCALLFRKS